MLLLLLLPLPNNPRADILRWGPPTLYEVRSPRAAQNTNVSHDPSFSHTLAAFRAEAKLCRSKRGWQQKVFLSASSERGTRGTRRSEELKDRRPAQGRPSLLVVRRTLRVRPPGGVWFRQRVLVQARSENLLPMAVKYLGL